MFKFDRSYKLLFSYLLIFLLTLFQIPPYNAAMRDFNLEVTLALVIIFMFKKNANRLEYIIALGIYIITSLVLKANAFEVILDMCGLVIFIKLYKKYSLLKTIYLIVIILSLLTYLIVPIIYGNTSFLQGTYFKILTSVSYIKYIITIFPAYLIFKWALNGLIIEYLINKKKLGN